MKKLGGSTAYILKQIEDTTTNLKAITVKTDTIISDNEKNIEDTLDNIRQMTQNLKETTDNVKTHPWETVICWLSYDRRKEGV